MRNGYLELHHTSCVRIAPENALNVNCAIDDEKPTYRYLLQGLILL
jgi:hypothetical protein